MNRILRHLAVAAAALATSPAMAQEPAACEGISAWYEEAEAWLAMIATRQVLRREMRGPLVLALVRRRIDNEIATLSVMDDGSSLNEVVERYRDCRFGLDRSIAALADGPRITVASNCIPCEGHLSAVEDALDTLHGVAEVQPDDRVIVREVLDERDRQIEELLACEQASCRGPWRTDNVPAPVSADYLAAASAAVDPEAWAREPVVASALPDYATPETPVGVYPVDPVQ